MPAALQCPDCGHQEMLDNLGGVATFRCGGCGRALKVPSQFRDAPATRGGRGDARPPSAGEPTQAMPRVAPGALPSVTAPGPVVSGAAIPAGAAMAPGAVIPPVTPMPGAGLPTRRSPLVGAGSAGGIPGDPAGPGGFDAVATPPPVVIPPGSLRPPLVLRLLLWVIALPLGSLIVFGIASSLKVLTKSQLEDTFLLAGWGRFLPIARLLPFCALATALLVQLGVFLLERLRARNLQRGPSARKNGGRGGNGRGPGGGRGPTRPLSPNGAGTNGQPTNGARTRDRVIS